MKLLVCVHKYYIIQGHNRLSRKPPFSSSQKLYPHPRIPAAMLFFVSLCFSVFPLTWESPQVGGGDHFLDSYFCELEFVSRSSFRFLSAVLAEKKGPRCCLPPLYIYIYIYRERERYTYVCNACMYVCMYVYTYIYIYMYIHTLYIYIYIYIYIHIIIYIKLYLPSVCWCQFLVCLCWEWKPQFPECNTLR